MLSRTVVVVLDGVTVVVEPCVLVEVGAADKVVVVVDSGGDWPAWHALNNTRLTTTLAQARVHHLFISTLLGQAKVPANAVALA
jgi:hypothetical protein